MSGMTIVITVAPSRDPDGHRVHSTRGQLFDGAVDGRRVVARSPTPFTDAARVLLAAGEDSTRPLVMHHAGSAHDALRSTVGRAAGLTVAESAGRPRLAKWRPNDWTAPKPRSAIPPMREMVLSAPHPTGRGRNAP